MSMSPSPFSFWLFQNTPYTPVPSCPFCHMQSLYVCSNSFISSTTGMMEDSFFASSLSSAILGSTTGSGYESIQSACFPTMQFHSHPVLLGCMLLPRTPRSFRISSQFFSFHHCCARITRFSILSLPLLYFSSVSVALFSRSLVMPRCCACAPRSRFGVMPASCTSASAPICSPIRAAASSSAVRGLAIASRSRSSSSSRSRSFHASGLPSGIRPQPCCSSGICSGSSARRPLILSRILSQIAIYLSSSTMMYSG